MTSKERMITAMWNRQADMVPVAPDMSNMIPCKLTGKPFWDIYLYQDPPLWKAYIHAAKRYGFDGWLAGAPIQFEHELPKDGLRRGRAIVKRTDDRIFVRGYTVRDGKTLWAGDLTVYYRDMPPTNLAASKLGMDAPPTDWQEVTGVKEQKTGKALYDEIAATMGDDGVVGVGVGLPSLGKTEDSILEYFDNHSVVKKRAEAQEEAIVRRTEKIIELRPDFILIGVSGLLTFQSPAIFRDLGLGAMKRVTKMAKAAGIPTQVHCCGRERELVKIAAEETDLSSINPLEVPPMGDCDLAEIKRSFGRKLGLMGNLHTTEVMLKGTPDVVGREARKCMDDAAAGGGFILSTGDQCGRDTPEENIYRLIETARRHGKY